jgi:hypothetical protein
MRAAKRNPCELTWKTLVTGGGRSAPEFCVIWDVGGPALGRSIARRHHGRWNAEPEISLDRKKRQAIDVTVK